MDRGYRVLGSASAAKGSYNVGLRTYMLSIYSHMCAALFVTGMVAYMVSRSPAMIVAMYTNGMFPVLMIGSLFYNSRNEFC